MSKPSKVALRCEKKFKMTLKAYVKQHVKQGLGAVKLAEKLACTPSNAYYIADKYGIKFNSRIKNKRKKK